MFPVLDLCSIDTESAQYIIMPDVGSSVLIDGRDRDLSDLLNAPSLQFITVEDVAGVRLWHLTPKVLTVLRALTGTMKTHYVER